MLAILSLVAPARGAVPEIGRAAPPAWVQPIPVDTKVVKKPGELDAGRYRLLSDSQVNVAEEIRYEHEATQFLTEGAVEDGGRISVTFDPEYESVSFHQLIVHRAGKPIDRLAKQEIKVLQREARLDFLQYDGRLSAVIILEDVRVGDILEYAYSIRGRNPIFGGKFMGAVSTTSEEPIHHLRYRVMWPSDRQLHFKSHGKALTPVVTPGGAVTEYVWEDRDVPGLISDREVPSWYEPWSWIQLSEFDSWGAVARWASAFTEVPPSVPEELEKELSQIALEKTEQDRVLAALRYVQDNIRYLAVEVGENSHKPYPIETILSRRFGDCKDKARMLSAMLRRLGFEAYPALVATDTRQVLAEWLPTAWAFDHEVVLLRFHGKDIWLDGTNRDQGGSLEQISFPPYALGLVVSPDTTALVPVPGSGLAEASTETAETFTFDDFSGAAALHVHTTYRGKDADGVRSKLADASVGTIRKFNLNYYARIYPQIEAVDSPAFQDDRAKNVIVADEKYRISGFWTATDKKTDDLSGDIYSQRIQDLLGRPSTRVRTMPYAVRYPKKTVHTIEVNFPRSMSFDDAQTVIDDPAFRYAYSRVASGAKVTIRHEYEARRDNVAAAATVKYLANVERARGYLGFGISIPRYWGSGASGGTGDGASSKGSPWMQLVFGVLIAVIAVIYLRARSGGSAENFGSVHRCVVCGETERSDPSLDFRVGANGRDYCNRHLPKRR